MSPVPLYTVGNFTIDDIVLWPGGEHWMGQPGGNVLFSALGARFWLPEVGVIARVGYDYPRERLNEIEARGICLGISEVAFPTLHDWTLYEANGARQFINHLNSGTNEEATIAPDEIPVGCLSARGYHIAPMPTHQQQALVERLGRPGCLISLDPHERWITGQEQAVCEMLRRVDLFLPSEVEARHLYGANDPEKAAVEFARHGPRAVIVKIGPEGALVYDRDRGQLTHVPVFPANAIDPTGAGDAFCGGFLAGYLLTNDILTAAVYGTVAASYVVEAIGALSTAQPSPAELRERLACVAASVRPPMVLQPESPLGELTH